ncbi:hypothetical protein [Nonomuraea dietziae]|uniref:hypothetical protein n=1 Tax=Nonomuraea dietziae TaxID=65515 RepID=UPI003332A1DB
MESPPPDAWDAAPPGSTEPAAPSGPKSFGTHSPLPHSPGGTSTLGISIGPMSLALSTNDLNAASDGGLASTDTTSPPSSARPEAAPVVALASERSGGDADPAEDVGSAEDADSDCCPAAGPS